MIKRKQNNEMPDMGNYYDRDEIDSMFENFEGGGGGDVDLSGYYTREEIDALIEEIVGEEHRSVSVLPEKPKAGVVYLIQGIVKVE